MQKISDYLTKTSQKVHEFWIYIGIIQHSLNEAKNHVKKRIRSIQTGN